VDTDESVTAMTALRHALAANAQYFPVSDAFGNFQSDRTVESLKRILGAKESVGKFHLEVADDVHAVFVPEFVRLDMDFHVEVARDAAFDGLALIGKLEHFPVVDASRNFHLEFLSDIDASLRAKYGVMKRNIQVDLDIAAATLARASAAENASEEVIEVKLHAAVLTEAALKSSLSEMREIKTAEIVRIETLPAEAGGVWTRGSEGVVLLAFLVVGKDAVGLANLFEFLGVAAFFVGMMFVREFAKRLFNIVLRRVFLDSERFVVIFCHNL